MIMKGVVGSTGSKAPSTPRAKNNHPVAKYAQRLLFELVDIGICGRLRVEPSDTTGNKSNQPQATTIAQRCTWGRIKGKILTKTVGAMGKFAHFIRTFLFLVGASLPACTEVGYVKPGMTDEEYAKDSQECAEIARQQAFREYNILQSRWRMYRPLPHQEDQRGYYRRFGPSLAELEFDYRRLCMMSRGYELAPLEESNKPDIQ
jgi:hypothetical protein